MVAFVVSRTEGSVAVVLSCGVIVELLVSEALVGFSGRGRIVCCFMLFVCVHAPATCESGCAFA